MRLKINGNKAYFKMTPEEAVDLIGRLAVTVNDVHRNRLWDTTSRAIPINVDGADHDRPGIVEFSVEK